MCACRVPSVTVGLPVYRENMKKIMSETAGPRVLIFGMKHHLVDLYQVCLNYTPEAENGSPPWVTYFT